MPFAPEPKKEDDKKKDETRKTVQLTPEELEKIAGGDGGLGRGSNPGLGPDDDSFYGA